MTDVLILGGGVIGLSLAYDLAVRGSRVQVVDQGEFGQEASWAGAGMIPDAMQNAREHPLDQLAGLSSTLHPQWHEKLLEETGIDNGYRRCGAIYLAREPESWHALELAADDWLGRKQRAERLDAQSLADLEPALACSCRATGWPHRVLAAYHLPNEAQLRNPWHVRALIAACERRGVSLTNHCQVTGFELNGDRITGVNTKQELLRAGQIVVCSGAWTAMILSQLNCAVRIKPIRGQIILYRGNSPLLHRVVNEGPRYLVPRDDGRVLVGSTEEDVGFEKGTTEAGIQGLKEFCRDVCPAVADLPIEKCWSGLRPATSDGVPYLGKIPHLENAFVAAGHYRGGVHLSPGTAVVMSQCVLGESTAIDLTPFGVERTN